MGFSTYKLSQEISKMILNYYHHHYHHYYSKWGKTEILRWSEYFGCFGSQKIPKCFVYSLPEPDSSFHILSPAFNEPGTDCWPHASRNFLCFHTVSHGTLHQPYKAWVTQHYPKSPATLISPLHNNRLSGRCTYCFHENPYLNYFTGRISAKCKECKCRFYIQNWDIVINNHFCFDPYINASICIKRNHVRSEAQFVTSQSGPAGCNYTSPKKRESVHVSNVILGDPTASDN